MRLKHGLIVTGLLLLVIGCEGIESSDPFVEVNIVDWLPVAATATNPQGQGGQDLFYSQSNDAITCSNGGVVAEMNQRSLCYVQSGGDLYCAGEVYTSSLSTFTDMGQTNVLQLMPSPYYFNVFDREALCVRKSDGTAWCFGETNTDYGQFNISVTGGVPGATWTRWGTRSDISSMVSLGNEAICGIYSDQTASCVGYLNLGAVTHAFAPVSMGTGVESLYLDATAEPFVNSATIFRVSPIWYSSYIEAGGLTDIYSGISSLGTPGHVVDGNYAGEWNMFMTWCWLEDTGDVFCYEPRDATDLIYPKFPGTGEGYTIRRYFTDQPVLRLLLFPDTLSLDTTAYPTQPRCAVYRDGSISCIGQNVNGRFGAAVPHLTVETEIRPAGTVQNRCAE